MKDNESILRFDEKQIEFLRQNGLDFDFENLSEGAYFQVQDTIGDLYTRECQMHEKEATPVILMCESILDTLARME